ncbi:helix-turn-helix domain-containing protein [Gemmiger formicilis]
MSGCVVLRKAKGLTQAQLGELVGCAKNTISSYESGVNRTQRCSIKQ